MAQECLYNLWNLCDILWCVKLLEEQRLLPMKFYERTKGNFPASLPPQQMIAATNRARSLSSSSSALNFMANWNFGSIISLNGRRRLLRNSRVMKPEPYATRSPSLFIQEASRANRASYTPYFKRVTWSLRSRLENPGTDFANSVSSVTVSTEVHWQQWKIRTSASLSFSTPAVPTILATSVCSASWRVSMSWITKGCEQWRTCSYELYV